MGRQGPKQYLNIGKKPIICHTLEQFSSFTELIIVVESDRVEAVRAEIVEAFNFPQTWQVIAGGKERQHSVQNGLEQVSSSCELVLVHDGVRPFIDKTLIDQVLMLAAQKGAAIVAAPMQDTVKQINAAGEIIATKNRQELWRAQTPQAFQVEILKAAFAKAAADNFIGTDEASLVERLGKTVAIVEGNDYNIKLTTPKDLAMAEFVLQNFSSGKHENKG